MSFQANDHIQAPAQPAVQTSKDCLKDFSNSMFDRVLPDASAPTVGPGPVEQPELQEFVKNTLEKYPSEQHTRIISEGLAAAPIFKKSLKTAQTQLDLTQQKIVKHDKKKLDRAIRAQGKANDLDRVWGSRDAWLPKDLIPADSRRFTTEQQPRLPVNDRIIEELMTITKLAVDNQIPLPSLWANNAVLTRACKKRGETGSLTRTAAESAVKMLKEELEARRANRNETVEDDFGDRDLSVPPEVGRGRDADLSDNDTLAVSRLDSPATNGPTQPEVVAAKVPAATSTEATGPSPSPSPRPQKRARDTTEDAGDGEDTAKLRATKRSITRLVAEVNVPPETVQELEKRLSQAQEVLAEARTQKSKYEKKRKVLDDARKVDEGVRERWAAFLDSEKNELETLPDQIEGSLRMKIVQRLDIDERAFEEANVLANRCHTERVRDLDKRLEESASEVHQLEAQVQELEKQLRQARICSQLLEIIQHEDMQSITRTRFT
ncbi:hypothetical protein QBC37DRAFT_428482 [Rhypophila decipiens]|uniref:Uncharacterized protein n=1 Tax=Rhypophila decipiens TaxID=261697 RepID=A0AAN6Y5R1_9PEZI|nr:hypothetical protein QBC37DRAFT_428482 [Rhypophila decipiens]